MALPKIQWPIFEIIVPSLQRKIKFRQILVREEKILLIAKQSGEISDILLAVKQIINNCVIPEVVSLGFDIDKLPIFDLEWVFMQLTALSFSNVVHVTYQDNEDEQLRTFDVKLDEIKPPSIEGINNNIEIGNGIGIIFDFPPASLYHDSFFMNKETSMEELIDYLTIKCVKRVYGPEEVYSFTEEELKGFIDDLDMKTMKRIRDFFSSIPTMTYTIEYTNDKQNQRKIVLSTLNDFFSWV